MMLNPASKALLEELHAGRKKGLDEAQLKEELLKKFQGEFTVREIELFIQFY
ncbi:MAG: hypothetical protein LKG31_01570 [Lactobacillus sp.]|jgi:hypothetical protein|nr:hypothetical protein [Lactobacillus sp.]